VQVSYEEAEVPSKGSYSEVVEVWLWEPGSERPPFSFDGALEFLPPAPPLPQVGDLLLLPRNVTGDTKEQAFAWAGKLSPFRVVEREHVYFREPGETVDPRHVKPARYMRSIILVRRLTEEEFHADPQI
jgi:hypothetical protein